MELNLEQTIAPDTHVGHDTAVEASLADTERVALEYVNSPLKC